MKIRKRGASKVVVRPDGQVEAAGEVSTQHDQPLLVALTLAFYWQQLLDDGVVSSGSEIAQREGLHHSTVNELLRLVSGGVNFVETGRFGNHCFRRRRPSR